MKAKRRPTRGSEAFREHVTGREKPAEERKRLACELGVDVMTVRRWEWAVRIPSDSTKADIERLIGVDRGEWLVRLDIFGPGVESAA